MDDTAFFGMAERPSWMLDFKFIAVGSALFERDLSDIRRMKCARKHYIVRGQAGVSDIFAVAPGLLSGRRGKKPCRMDDDVSILAIEDGEKPMSKRTGTTTPHVLADLIQI